MACERIRARFRAVLVVVVLCVSNAGVAATLTVTNLNDAGAGSLRAQVAVAATGDTIDFAVTGTIALTTGEVIIAKAVTITGPGPTLLSVSGSNQSRVFLVSDGIGAVDSPVAISGLRITGGNPTAGNPVGTCPAPSGSGGGIYSNESLTLTDVVIEGNVTQRNGGGIGFFPSASGQSLQIVDSIVQNNQATCPGATSAGQGGGIELGWPYSFAPLSDMSFTATLTRVRILNNTAQRRGGGIDAYFQGVVTITDSVISGNVANDVQGGGLQLTWGGQDYARPATLQMRDSEVSGNVAPSVGGISLLNALPASQTPATTANSSIVNSTVSGNVATTSTAGGIQLYGNVGLVLANSTVAANAAQGTTAASAGVRLVAGYNNGDSAQPANIPATLTIDSSIVAGNTATTGTTPDLNGVAPYPSSVTANNSLVQSHNASIVINGAGNLFGVAPLLGPLSFNGGATRTHALLAGSPALNAGSNPLGLATDQRGIGFPRVSGAAADMGAYESVVAAAPLLQTVVSRKTHGAAGVFNLALSGVPTAPTTEPRLGPAQTLVFAFDKPVTGGSAAVTEGTATVGAVSASGSELVVPLTAVSNYQYVTVAVSNVSASDGGTGGVGTVRVGFLPGDVNQNRVVTLADLGQVNAQVAQAVTAANYLKDVNASGTLSLADKGLTNQQLTKALAAP